MKQRLTILALVSAVIVSMVRVSMAQPEQTPAEMRTEIDLLRQRIAQLEAQLEAARERAERHAEEAAQLRAQLAERPSDAPEAERDAEGAEALEVPIERSLELEAVPEAWESSPDSLFAALQLSYREAMEGMPRESRSDQQRYYASVGKWARDAERTHRGDVEWTVRITRVLERPDRAGDVTMQVVNPETGRGWGEPFTMTMTRAHRELLEAASDRHYWVMAGSLTAKPQLNRERESPGFFLHPLFIGAFAEFEYEFKVRRLTPTTLKKREEGAHEDEASSETEDADAGV